MKISTLLVFPYIALAELTGVYQLAKTDGACSKVIDLYLGSDNTFFKRHCTSNSTNKISFGIYRNNEDKLQEFYYDGNVAQISYKINDNSLVYDNLVLEKKQNSSFENLGKLIGKFNNNKSTKCEDKLSLEFKNNGQFYKTYCINNDIWYNHGLFNVISFDGESILINTVVNNTSNNFNLKVIGNDVELDGKVLLNRI